MQDALPPCPRCGAAHVVRNGLTRAGSVNLLCRGCGRRFVPDPKRAPITPEREDLVRRLLLERLSLRAVARVAGVSRSWLQRFANALYRQNTPRAPGRLKKSPATR
jgi:transposase-like protein